MARNRYNGVNSSGGNLWLLRRGEWEVFHMGTLAGTLGPSLSEIRADTSQSITIRGRLIHGLQPDLSWEFALLVDGDGKVQGHYGGRVTGQQITGSWQPNQGCQLHVGGHLVGATVTLHQNQTTIEGQVRRHLRSWDVHYTIDGTRMYGLYGHGPWRKHIDIEAVDVAPLLAAGLLCLACYHFTVVDTLAIADV